MPADTKHTADSVTPSSLADGGNALLAILSDRDRALVAPSCRRVRLLRGDLLAEADQSSDALYFIEYGVASIIRSYGKGEMTEIALAGLEGFIGAPLVLGDGRWPYRTVVQVDQLCAIRLPATEALETLHRSRTFERLLSRAAHAQMIQIAENLVSVAWQRLDARLARWLLMYRDRLRSDRLEVTHEFMAIMVGVQRTGITEALHEMEGAGLITASRGLVILRDLSRIRDLASLGYGVAEREYDRLMGLSPADAGVEAG
jgi:CRP-like cAMP-binding protein